MSVVVKVEDVCKNFSLGKEEVKVLKNLTFDIKKGEFVSLMGPSGSGKSTLLYLIGGLDNPTTGKVMINDKELKLMKDEEESIMRRRDIGFVFQFYNLIPNLNVEENILLPILLDGKNASKYKDELTDILRLVGLEDRRKHTPKELSGGQQQRVAIARALINDPDIILADEPIGNLDSVTGTEIMELFKRINVQKKKTIIQVTHNASSAEYGNRVINLKDGRIV
ncbi:MAG: ABC transporter ATP-binding protein [Acidaminobacteraceae bacterium]